MRLSSVVLPVLLLFLLVNNVTSSGNVVLIEYFYVYDPSISGCPECGADSETERVDQIMSDITKDYGDLVTLEKRNIFFDKNLDLWREYNFTVVPAVVINGDYTLEGEQITKEELLYVIDGYLLGEKPYRNPYEILSAVSLGFSVGFLSGFSPCLIAMLAFILTYISSTDSRLRGGITRALIFGLGLVVAFMLVGSLLFTLNISVFNVLVLLQSVTWVSAAIMLIVGLNLIGFLKLPVSSKPIFQKLARKYGFGLVGLFALGVVFFFAKIHFVAPPDLMLFTSIVHGGIGQNMLITLSYSLGLLTPFLIVGIISGGTPYLARQIREKYRLAFRIISGLILIAYSIWLVLWAALL